MDIEAIPLEEQRDRLQRQNNVQAGRIARFRDAALNAEAERDALRAALTDLVAVALDGANTMRARWKEYRPEVDEHTASEALYLAVERAEAALGVTNERSTPT